MLERILTGLAAVALVGVIAVCLYAWRKARRKSERLVEAYERLALLSEVSSVTTGELARVAPRPAERGFVSMARPPSELRPRIAVGPVRERYPTVMNLPAARVSDDADDDLWLRRSLDIHVVHVPAPAINAASPSEPWDFEGQGGSFGGAGASGGWEPANDAPAAPDPAPAVDTPTTDFGGDFSNDP